MNSLLRWFRRRWELGQIAGRRQELEQELTAHFQANVQLTPAAAKGGYDEIFYATRAGHRFAVVRVNSPFKRQNDPIGPRDPAVPLEFKDRLEREWDAYARLFPADLSPQPLWRAADAIACSWLDWERASVRLTQQRDQFWPLFEQALQLIRRMHELGVVHLDLNWGNLLVSAAGNKLAVIDFEFGPVPWVTREQQQAYDYLRILDDSLKPRRGGRLLLADVPRAARLLDQTVPATGREAVLEFVFDKLHRLAAATELRERLQQIFPNLNR